MDLKKNLGIIIRDYRKSKFLSTQELANKLNLSVGTINNIENGKSDFFKFDILFKLLYILEIPSTVIFENIATTEEFVYNKYKESLTNYKFPSFNLLESPDMLYDLTKIIYNISEFISQFKDKQAALIIISNTIMQQIEMLNKFALLEDEKKLTFRQKL